MIRFTFSFLLILSVSLSSNAQTDSLNVVKAQWNTRKVSRGITLKQFSFNKSLFGSNQNVSILEVKQKRRYHFDLGYEKQALRTTSDFGKSADAIAAINGTFFDVKNGGSVDYIRSDGKEISHNRLGKDGSRALHQAAAVVFRKGKLSIAKWNGDKKWEQSVYADDMMNSGPLLLMEGRPELIDTAKEFNKARHPRSALAITKNKKVLMVTVDGRNENSAGMSLTELTALLRWLGAKDGLNLDGGGSTTLWVNAGSENGVVNYPTDNKKWDHEGERKVANVILLKKRD